jgi:hypothetical protein
VKVVIQTPVGLVWSRYAGPEAVRDGRLYFRGGGGEGDGPVGLALGLSPPPRYYHHCPRWIRSGINPNRNQPVQLRRLGIVLGISPGFVSSHFRRSIITIIAFQGAAASGPERSPLGHYPHAPCGFATPPPPGAALSPMPDPESRLALWGCLAALSRAAQPDYRAPPDLWVSIKRSAALFNCARRRAGVAAWAGRAPSAAGGSGDGPSSGSGRGCQITAAPFSPPLLAGAAFSPVRLPVIAAGSATGGPVPGTATDGTPFPVTCGPVLNWVSNFIPAGRSLTGLGTSAPRLRLRACGASSSCAAAAAELLPGRAGRGSLP